MACLKRDSRVVVNRNNKFQSEADGNNSESDKSIAVFLDYARSLCREKKLMEAISVLGVVSKLSKDVPLESVKDLVDSLVDKYTVLAANITCVTDAWSCVFCSYVLEDPVTMICGHSCCRKCLTKNLTSVCKKCKTKYTPIEEDPIDPEPYIKLNILISELVKKFWSKELEATRLREEGNRLFQRNKVSESISKYSEAVLLCPDDYLCLSNRSNAHYKNNNLEDALSDAELSIQCKPDWGRSYLRKGMALSAMHKYEEAIAALIKGYILENGGSKLLKLEIARTMQKLIQTKGKEAEDYLPTSSVIKSPVKFSSQPNLSRDSSDGDETEDDTESRVQDNRKLLISKNPRLCSHLRRIDESVQSFIKSVKTKSERHIDPNAVNKDDFECSLCFRVFWQPVTTSCGHTFCRACLDRSLDHKPECPLCKHNLFGFQKSEVGVNEFVEATIKRMLPAEHSLRLKQVEDEMNEMIGGGNVSQIPVFVCTMSFPGVTCPLHVFEPRYRLMIRRAMESGTRQFGMCVGNQENGFSDYGTMLEIRDIQYFDDGRSVVDTIGGRRFKVLSRGVKDGYNTANVEFLHDDVLEGESLEALKKTHDKIRQDAELWFSRMDVHVKSGILNHYGDIPGLEHEYWRLANGPAWCWWVLAIMPLDQIAQQQILSQTQLVKRLEAIAKILGYMKRKGCF